MATNTYVALDKVTLGSATGSVTFSSISSGYTDLVIVANVQRATTAENPSVTLRFNGDTTTTYSMTNLLGNGSAASPATASSQNMMNLSYFSLPSADSFAPYIINVMNYSNATTYKTVIARGGNAGTGTQATVGLWRSTAAITSVTITNDGSPTNFSVGSTFSLYGIANADAFAKATGGIVYDDATYWYHVFGASGTFTPKQSLSVDTLVVAGGGGGGSAGGSSGRGAGAGGAGGYRTATAQSVTTTPYTITVGAGGAGGTGTWSNGAKGSDSIFSTITSTGGGFGSSQSGGGSGGGNGGDGGSGGGQGNASGGTRGGLGNTPSTSPSQGNNGGADGGAVNGGGGGGGAGGVGSPSNITGGAGGPGVSNSYSGTAVTYAAGGKGGDQGGNSAGANGIANTGNGAGGANGGSANSPGGAGGSGIVIIRYLKA